MSEFVDKMKVLISRPLFKVILLGIFIRILLIPFSLVYDSNFWTVVIRNIESGYGLYQMEGYYYTPVWGYVLGFVAGIQNLLFDIGDPSVICYDLFSYLSIQGYAYSDMGISIVFLFILKTILTISDLVMSVILYQMVMRRTGDERKATIAFLLLFVCPHIIGASSMITMPDTLSAMFTMLTIVLLRDDKYFFAGICYALAVWVKFFPIAIILVLLCYIYVETEGDVKKAAERIGKAFLGFMLMSVIIFFPQFDEGTLAYCLAFLTDRIIWMIEGGILNVIGMILGSIAIIFVAMHVGRHMLRSKGDRDDRLMEYSMILLSICMLVFTNLQYLVSLMPFLIYCIVVISDRYKYVWILLAVAGVILTFMLNTNAVMFNSLVVYTDIISSSFTTSLFDVLNEEIILGWSIVDMFCSFANNIQKACLVLIPAIFIIRRLIAKEGRKTHE